MEQHHVCVTCGMVFDEGPPTQLPCEDGCGSECVVVVAFVCAGAGDEPARIEPPPELTARFGAARPRRF